MQKRTARPRGKCDGPKQLAIYAAAAAAANIHPHKVMERRACYQLIVTMSREREKWKTSEIPLAALRWLKTTDPADGWKQNSTSTLKAAGQVTFPPNCVWECFYRTGKDLSGFKLNLHFDMTFGRHSKNKPMDQLAAPMESPLGLFAGRLNAME